ncbi:hypothetical protein LK12_07830 [Novosphingobium malaysiense]|uniref:HTH tetR-type domain-containing protein n=1 Tax=Novosphingobium malaysiense TaxID=1348853 RepID=A0A0B1ZTH1_9SPHN|nr:hypothetical protein LK12_07830 [Novosphingobium malaysiense]
MRRRNGAVRREQIMDAAEQVFALRGYDGASLRDVARQADASLGVITHHFPSKENLLYNVVLRKRDPLIEIIRENLERAKNENKGDLGTIEAFIRPFLRSCIDSGSEFRTYIRLTSSFMGAYAANEVNVALLELLPISSLFAEFLRDAAPHIPDRKLKLAVYLIDAAVIFMVQDQGFLDQVTDGEYPIAAINELISPAATFFTGGLRALAETSD